MASPNKLADVATLQDTLYGIRSNIFERFGDLARADMVSKIFEVYPAKRVASFPWFNKPVDDRHDEKSPFGMRMFFRADNNKRQQDSVTEDYMETQLEHGLVPGVGGLPWATPCMKHGREVLALLSYATRADAFFLCLERHPENERMMKTLKNGLLDVTILGTVDRPFPEDVQIFLSEEHNKWHGGASANAIQQLAWIHESEQEWLLHADNKSWTRRSLPTSGDFTYDKVAWEHVRNQKMWRERFGDKCPGDFYEKGRLIHADLVKKHMLEIVTTYACKNCDFLNPDFKTMAFFRTLRYIQVRLEKYLDIHDECIVKLVMFEAIKMIIPRKTRANHAGDGRIPPLVHKDFVKDKIDLVFSPLDVRFLIDEPEPNPKVKAPKAKQSLGRSLKRHASEELAAATKRTRATKAKSSDVLTASDIKFDNKMKDAREMQWLDDILLIVEKFASAIASRRSESTDIKVVQSQKMNILDIGAMVMDAFGRASNNKVMRTLQEVVAIALEFGWERSISFNGQLKSRWRYLRKDLVKHLQDSFQMMDTGAEFTKHDSCNDQDEGDEVVGSGSRSSNTLSTNPAPPKARTPLEMLADEMDPIIYDINLMDKLSAVLATIHPTKPVQLQPLYAEMLNQVYNACESLDGTANKKTSSIVTIMAVGGPLFVAIPEKFVLAVNLAIRTIQCHATLPEELRSLFVKDGAGNPELKVLYAFRAMRVKFFKLCVEQMCEVMPNIFSKGVIDFVFSLDDPKLIAWEAADMEMKERSPIEYIDAQLVDFDMWLNIWTQIWKCASEILGGVSPSGSLGDVKEQLRQAVLALDPTKKPEIEESQTVEVSPPMSEAIVKSDPAPDGDDINDAELASILANGDTILSQSVAEHIMKSAQDLKHARDSWHTPSSPEAEAGGSSLPAAVQRHILSVVQSEVLKHGMADAKYGDSCHSAIFLHPSCGDSLFVRSLANYHRLTFVGRVTTTAKQGDLPIGDHSGMKFYLDRQEAYQNSQILNAAWWVKVVSDESVATMQMEKKQITINYVWKPCVLGQERKETIKVDVWQLTPKIDFFGQPCMLTRGPMQGETVPTKSKGKGKAKGKGKCKDSETKTSNEEKKSPVPRHLS